MGGATSAARHATNILGEAHCFFFGEKKEREKLLCVYWRETEVITLLVRRGEGCLYNATTKTSKQQKGDSSFLVCFLSNMCAIRHGPFLKEQDEQGFATFLQFGDHFWWQREHMWARSIQVRPDNGVGS